MSGKRVEVFTLVELLVVIAIVALLTGTLLPALKKARDKGCEIACASKLKQLGLGFQMYTVDYNDYMPYGYQTGNGPDRVWTQNKGDGLQFDIMIAPYLNYRFSYGARQPEMFHCPSEQYCSVVIAAYPWLSRGYGQNAQLQAYYLPLAGYVAHGRLSRIARPSDIFNLTDIYIPDPGWNETFVGGGYVNYYPVPAPHIKAFRHNGAVNALFLDGHTDKRYRGTPCPPAIAADAYYLKSTGYRMLADGSLRFY